MAMDPGTPCCFQSARRIVVRLPHKADLPGAIQALCERENIRTAVFNVIGSAFMLTIGTYDQKQQVHVTHQEEGSFEILSCCGNVSLQEDRPVVNGRIVAADVEGRVVGGSMFSETLIHAAEIDLQELTGPLLHRSYDAVTGLMLWRSQFSGGDDPDRQM